MPCKTSTNLAGLPQEAGISRKLVQTISALATINTCPFPPMRARQAQLMTHSTLAAFCGLVACRVHQFLVHAIWPTYDAAAG